MSAHRDEQQVERAEVRVEAILAPYSRELTPGLLAQQIVEAVLEEIVDDER